MLQEQRQTLLEEIPAGERTRPVLTLGRTVATPGALSALEAAHETGAWYLRRHQCGDWGDPGAEDWATNDIALREGTRILSAYQLATGEKLRIIVRRDRRCSIPAEGGKESKERP